MKVTKSAPVFPSLKAHLQDQYTEMPYTPRKKPEMSFKNLLEKELLPKVAPRR